MAGKIDINQTVSFELITMQNGFHALEPTQVLKSNMAETNLKKADACIEEHKQISDVIWSLKLAGLVDVKDAMNQIRDFGDVDDKLAKAIKDKGTVRLHITNREKEAKGRARVLKAQKQKSGLL